MTKGNKMQNLTSKTKTAIAKYGIETCRKAFDRHDLNGEGANTVGFYLKLTTRQADAAINAGRELSSQ
jgi:hypothetical protein